LKYSIVIPVYNTEEFLPRCLDSLKAQTDRDFEVIVVDDCSPGDAGRSGIAPYQVGDAGRSESAHYQAEEIVKRYDARFKCVRHATNRSAFQARCTGVAAAKGDYVVPVDPDDYLLPETLAKLRAVIERESPDLVSYWIDYDDGRKTYPHWCRHPAATVTGAEALRELVEHRYFTGVASKAFRREPLLRALRALAAPEETYVNTCDDFLMLVAVLVESGRVAFLDYAGYRYYVNEGSTSFSWRTRAGFRRAQDQMHLVGELLRRRAGRADVSPAVRSLVSEAVAGIEEWFAQMKGESAWTHRLRRRLAQNLAKLFSRSRPS